MGRVLERMGADQCRASKCGCSWSRWLHGGVVDTVWTEPRLMWSERRVLPSGTLSRTLYLHMNLQELESLAKLARRELRGSSPKGLRHLAFNYDYQRKDTRS